MRRRRALFSSSDQPGWQNSSNVQRTAGSAPTAGAVASGSSATGQQYTTLYLTRTQYTTFIYSDTPSSRSHSSAVSSAASSKSSNVSSGSTSSFASAFTYRPTTFSTTTTARATSHSTTTVRFTVYVTSVRTVVESTFSSTTSITAQDTSSTILPAAATSSSDVGEGSGVRGPQMVSPDGSSKHSAAIAGGMTGSVAGIALIGLIFLFLFRRRRRRPSYEEKNDMVNEPRMSSSSQALPSTVAAAGATRNPKRDTTGPLPRRSESDRLPVIDHNLIHMDLDHWDRPFAHEDPHLRDDASPLRLMNPDPTPTPPVILSSSSASASPDPASGNPHRFLQRQRSALSAALLSIKRSFSSQDVVPRHASDETHLHPSAHPSPLHIQDKATNKLTMPSEVILAGAAVSRPISSQSAMSSNTVIRHKVPEDPFVTSATPNSPLPDCLQPGYGVARRDFLAPPPLRTRMPMQSSPIHPQHGTVSPLTRSNSDCSTRFESLSPTRSEVSSVRSGPFDLATASVVGDDRASEPVVTAVPRSQRDQTPNWEVHVCPGT